jgi:MGT family glycosyltransferase
MSRILAYTSPARGHLFPLVPILDELAARGHEVHVRTLSSEVATLSKRGLHAEAVAPSIEAIEHDDWTARDPRSGLKRSVATFCRRAAEDAPDLRRAIEAVAPDGLIVDIQSWGAFAAAEAWGGPWVSFCPYPLPVPSVDVPPFGPGLPLARGPAGRLRDRLLRPVVHGSLLKILEGPVNDVRRAEGLDPLPSPDDLFTRPPLVLYMTAEPFEYPRRDWPPNIEMIGPSAWDPPAEAPAWLAEVERPIVLVTTSSEFQDDSRLVRTAFEALAGEDFEVVATLPAQDAAKLEVPSNARALPFVPHAAVLDHAACAITHGGMGATQKALARGIPVCVVPFGRDQLEVARRVEAAGAGARLPARRLRPDRLRTAVHDALSKRAGAERIAEAFASAGGAPRAADLYETLLSTRNAVGSKV